MSAVPRLTEHLDPSCLLASEVCEMPFAAISLFVHGRLRLCSSHGLPLSQTPPRLDFCEEAFRRPHGLYICDALMVKDFIECAWVKGPLSIRFYCGVPLVDSQGQTFGVLCVADQRPRELSESRRRALFQLGCQVSQMLENQVNELPASQVAGSLIHEMSNPLMILDVHLQQLRDSLQRTDKDGSEMSSRTSVSFSLGKCRQMVDRMHAIMNSTRLLYTPEASKEFRSVRLMDCMEDALSILQESFQRRKISLFFDFDRELHVQGELTMISQIFTNLFQNSAVAMESLDSRWIEISAFRDGPWVRIRIKDAGAGIPEILHSRIMSPYFSTHKEKGGSGLGLSICQSLAEKMGGLLILDTQSDRTCFELSLPSREV